jgi:hypothetical protein
MRLVTEIALSSTLKPVFTLGLRPGLKLILKRILQGAIYIVPVNRE